ncbi:hypothetical protein ACPX19_11310 [Winogradskyella sp. HB-48]|uniref:hypothetical protein n=1 Tax=Winogradskyella sp. HB-48 TaxID=3416808 RepID=UPI003CFB9CA2
MIKFRYKKDRLRFQKFVRNSWIYTFGGFIALTYGSFRFIFIFPNTGINFKTLQPVVINGSVTIMVGFGFFVAGVYRLINKEKMFQDELQFEDEMKEKEKEDEKRKKNRGYVIKK